MSRTFTTVDMSDRAARFSFFAFRFFIIALTTAFGPSSIVISLW
jgi:hypothetical protein